MEEEKKCRICGETKPYSEFYKTAGGYKWKYKQ